MNNHFTVILKIYMHMHIHIYFTQKFCSAKRFAAINGIYSSIKKIYRQRKLVLSSLSIVYLSAWSKFIIVFINLSCRKHHYLFHYFQFHVCIRITFGGYLIYWGQHRNLDVYIMKPIEDVQDSYNQKGLINWDRLDFILIDLSFR